MTKYLRNPDHRVRLAWVLLVASLVGWPVSALTVASAEPQFVLGLSWLAITLTALDILATTDVRKEQENGDEDAAEEATLALRSPGLPRVGHSSGQRRASGV